MRAGLEQSDPAEPKIRLKAAAAPLVSELGSSLEHGLRAGERYPTLGKWIFSL